MYTIPISSDAGSFKQQVVLDNAVYHLRLNWNSRNAFWTMDVFDLNLQPVVYGIKLVTGCEVLRQYLSYPVPQGSIFVFKSGGEMARVLEGELGTVADLVYVTEAERAAV